MRGVPYPPLAGFTGGVGRNALAASVPTASPQPHTSSRPPRLHSCLRSSITHAAELAIRMDRDLAGPTAG